MFYPRAYCYHATWGGAMVCANQQAKQSHRRYRVAKARRSSRYPLSRWVVRRTNQAVA